MELWEMIRFGVVTSPDTILETTWARTSLTTSGSHGIVKPTWLKLTGPEAD